MIPRPSSLPMVAQCPQFEGHGSDFADMGTDRHAALKGYLTGDMAEFDLLDDESQVAIRWFGDYIRLHAPTSDYPLIIEEKVRILYPTLDEVEGTPDAACGPELFDFKWRRRDYTAQMAAYALPMFGRHDRVRVHVGYGAECRADVFYLDCETADKIVEDVLSGLGGQPRPCDYCGWCAKCLICPAHTGPAKTVALGYSDLAEVSSWHPSEMDKPEHLALALLIWRKVLKKWGESVEYHALEGMTKKGWKLPGCEVATSRGKKFIGDTAAAHGALGLPPTEFLKACAPRLNTSKKYPDRLGLDKVCQAHFHEPSLAVAKRNLLRKLGNLVQTGKDTLKIKLTNGDDEEDSE